MRLLYALYQLQTVDRREHCAYRCSCDVGAYADTISNASALCIHHMDICCRLRVGTVLQRMLLVIKHSDIHAEGNLQSSLDRIDRAVADCIECTGLACQRVVHDNLCIEFAGFHISDIRV